MLHGATPAETCFATPLHTSFSQQFQRVTAALFFRKSFGLGHYPAAEKGFIY